MSTVVTSKKKWPFPLDNLPKMSQLRHLSRESGSPKLGCDFNLDPSITFPCPSSPKWCYRDFPMLNVAHEQNMWVQRCGYEEKQVWGDCRPSAIKALFGPGTNHVAIFENLAIFTKICKAQYTFYTIKKDQGSGQHVYKS